MRIPLQKCIVYAHISDNMSDIGQIYTPETVQETPFPQEDPLNYGLSQSTSGGTYTTVQTKDQSFPTKRIAVELLSSVLNTKSKKILQEFEFTESGAIQVGKYTNGVNGDIRISPSGITARDPTGSTTFALDGDTGDAVFAGQLRAGATIVSNTIVTEESSSGNGRTVYYNDGVASIIIGDPT